MGTSAAPVGALQFVLVVVGGMVGATHRIVLGQGQTAGHAVVECSRPGGRSRRFRSFRRSAGGRFLRRLIR
uniref:Putative secreted protein n=1 Tax=Anopheles darlingi TaxID=43151 RepID=A0A2M4DCD9_ANODA